MTDKISFDLVSPERLLLSEDAEMVTIPGAEGEMGVMAGHMSLISTLKPGIIDAKLPWPRPEKRSSKCSPRD